MIDVDEQVNKIKKVLHELNEDTGSFFSTDEKAVITASSIIEGFVAYWGSSKLEKLKNASPKVREALLASLKSATQNADWDNVEKILRKYGAPDSEVKKMVADLKTSYEAFQDLDDFKTAICDNFDSRIIFLKGSFADLTEKLNAYAGYLEEAIKGVPNAEGIKVNLQAERRLIGEINSKNEEKAKLRGELTEAELKLASAENNGRKLPPISDDEIDELKTAANGETLEGLKKIYTEKREEIAKRVLKEMEGQFPEAVPDVLRKAKSNGDLLKDIDALAKKHKDFAAAYRAALANNTEYQKYRRMTAYLRGLKLDGRPLSEAIDAGKNDFNRGRGNPEDAKKLRTHIDELKKAIEDCDNTINANKNSLEQVRNKLNRALEDAGIPKDKLDEISKLRTAAEKAFERHGDELYDIRTGEYAAKKQAFDASPYKKIVQGKYASNDYTKMFRDTLTSIYNSKDLSAKAKKAQIAQVLREMGMEDRKTIKEFQGYVDEPDEAKRTKFVNDLNLTDDSTGVNVSGMANQPRAWGKPGKFLLTSGKVVLGVVAPLGLIAAAFTYGRSAQKKDELRDEVVKLRGNDFSKVEFQELMLVATDGVAYLEQIGKISDTEARAILDQLSASKGEKNDRDPKKVVELVNLLIPFGIRYANEMYDTPASEEKNDTPTTEVGEEGRDYSKYLGDTQTSSKPDIRRGLEQFKVLEDETATGQMFDRGARNT